MIEEESSNEENSSSVKESDRNHGVQPLDGIMSALGMSNHDLVAAGSQPFTHKAVVRARKGRQLTPRMKVRLTEALNHFLKEKGEESRYGVKQLFNY